MYATCNAPSTSTAAVKVVTDDERNSAASHWLTSLKLRLGTRLAYNTPSCVTQTPKINWPGPAIKSGFVLVKTVCSDEAGLPNRRRSSVCCGALHCSPSNRV